MHQQGFLVGLGEQRHSPRLGRLQLAGEGRGQGHAETANSGREADQHRGKALGRSPRPNCPTGLVARHDGSEASGWPDK